VDLPHEKIESVDPNNVPDFGRYIRSYNAGPEAKLTAENKIKARETKYFIQPHLFE
jgi:hypothetical protein